MCYVQVSKQVLLYVCALNPFNWYVAVFRLSAWSDFRMAGCPIVRLFGCPADHLSDFPAVNRPT